MFVKKEYKKGDLRDNSKQLISELKSFSKKGDTNISLYANAANHLKNYFGTNVNWIGFYLTNEQNNLDLGPFNGLPAVSFIENKKGVCGTCLAKKETIVIKDVCAEPNHIVCDINSKSEITIPVFVNNKMVGLLDSDAPTIDFFEKYKDLLEEYILELTKYLSYENKDVIYLAGGCFWGVEEYFSRIKGVLDTEVGYANSSLKFPSYKDICTNKSDGVEAVRVVYDKEIISLEKLLEALYKVIDPTSYNKQGEDEGGQYRTGIYTNNKSDFEIAAKSLAELQKNFNKKVLVENLFLTNFYEAEDYHQDYLKKNPNGYCHIKL